MRILKSLESVRNIRGPLFLTFGFFDGFHAGHRLVLQHLIKRVFDYSAESTSRARSLVVTFETLPDKDFGSKKHIYPSETKIHILKKMGVDYCLVLDFEQVRQLDYKSFLDAFFLPHMKIAGLVASDKLCLGYQRSGIPKQVKKYFSEKRSQAFFLSSIKFKATSVLKEISSTEIRNFLMAGNIFRANQKLRLPFHLIGTVKKGKAWGRKIGFPTINFPYPQESIKIPVGSYITISVVKKRIYPSMSYVGIPMGGGGKKKKKLLVETYLLNFSKSVYNNKVVVYFIKNLEKNKRIRSLTELQIFLNCLRDRLEKYLEKKPVFFQEKIKWIKQTLTIK